MQGERQKWWWLFLGMGLTSLTFLLVNAANAMSACPPGFVYDASNTFCCALVPVAAIPEAACVTQAQAWNAYRSVSH